MLRTVSSKVLSNRRPLLVRTYLGGASDPVAKLSATEEALYAIAKPKSEAILTKHRQSVNLELIPETSLDTKNSLCNDAIRKKRLIYRSKQRGWLEVDLLLGAWAHAHVPKLSSDELDEFEAFVNAETIDIYNIITLRTTSVPDEWKTSHCIVERIQEWAKNHPLGKADPQQYKKVKTDAKLI